MDNHEQSPGEEELSPSAEDFDYNREPPLDSTTARINRGRSKYVFMTLCFLLALVLLYTYINGTFATNDSANWFPLLAAIVLAVMGVVFLRSSDRPAKTPPFIEPEKLPEEEKPDSLEEASSPFEALVQEALSSIPAEFQAQMENVMVRVVYEPDEEVLVRVGVKEGYTLLGLYEGTPLTTYGRANASYPEIITIYQRPIERYCQHDPERIREQVRKTVLHELAHHFGIGHEEMPIWVQ